MIRKTWQSVVWGEKHACSIGATMLLGYVIFKSEHRSIHEEIINLLGEHNCLYYHSSLSKRAYLH